MPKQAKVILAVVAVVAVAAVIGILSVTTGHRAKAASAATAGPTGVVSSSAPGPSLPTAPNTIAPYTPAKLPTKTWTPTQAQVTAAERAIIRTAAALDPAVPDDRANDVGAAATTWSPNVTKVTMLATDRASAQEAMGTPDAVIGASGNVLYFDITGQFQARGTLGPAVPGLPPPPKPGIALHLQYAMDPVTNSALDWGQVSYPSVFDTSAVEVLYTK